MSTRKRSLLAVGLILVAAWIGVLMVLRLAPERRAALIHQGMSRSEVEALLGGAPGNYSGGDDLIPILVPAALRGGREPKAWLFGSCCVMVYFDDSGLVHETDVWIRESDDPLVRIRRRLGL